MGTMLLIPWFRLDAWNIQILGGQVTLQPYIVTSSCASLVALVIALMFAKKHGRSLDLTLNLALYLVAFGFPVSSLFNGLAYEPDMFMYLISHPSQFGNVWLGWSMYGGVLGALLGAWVWALRYKGAFFATGDGFAFAMPFSWAIARVGCFVAHDHPGRVSNFALAVADFRVGQPPYVPRHDLGLYDALVFAAIAIIFVALVRKSRAQGFYIALLPLLYTPPRFALDFLRASVGEGGDIRYWGLTPGQYVSVGLFLAGVVTMPRVLRSTEPTAQPS